MIIGLFDPPTPESTFWTIPDCTTAVRPVIAERRLQAGVIVEQTAGVDVSSLPPMLESAVEIPLGERGDRWFGDGWHGPEAPGAQTLRWTGAENAIVRVVVSHQQPLRLRLAARLAERVPGGNALTLLWNGTAIATAKRSPIAGEWDIAAAIVRRGLNLLTVRVEQIVTPDAAAADTRRFGAAVTKIAIEPR